MWDPLETEKYISKLAIKDLLDLERTFTKLQQMIYLSPTFILVMNKQVNCSFPTLVKCH